MSIIYNKYIRYVGSMVSSSSAGSSPQVNLAITSSDSVSYTYPRDIETMVYRTSPTLILNDMNTEESRILLLNSPPRSPTRPPSVSYSPIFRYSSSHNPSYSPREQSRGASSSCSIGDPNEELNTSGSPLPITSEPLNFHVSTIYVPRARLNKLEELERNLSTIVGNGLMEYIYNENMTHTEESLQTSPHESGDDTDT